MAVEVSQILVEGEIQQDERFDEEVSFSQILVEGTDALQFKGVAFETEEQSSFKGVVFETEESGGFAQIIMLQK